MVAVETLPKTRFPGVVATDHHSVLDRIDPAVARYQQLVESYNRASGRFPEPILNRAYWTAQYLDPNKMSAPTRAQASNMAQFYGIELDSLTERLYYTLRTGNFADITEAQKLPPDRVPGSHVDQSLFAEALTLGGRVIEGLLARDRQFRNERLQGATFMPLKSSGFRQNRG